MAATAGAGSKTLDLLGGLARPSSDSWIEQVPMMGAQLTIFYSGMVNVYEDVPADRANAIVLLLENGGGRRRPPPAENQMKPVIGGVSSRASSRPSSPPPPAQKKQLMKRSQAELPFARKASLARFLEKRKDRVHAKVAALIPEEDNKRLPHEALKTP